MMESNRFWRGLEAELGADIEWVQGGNLALAANDERMALFEQWLPVARDFGLDSRIVSPADLLTVVPGLAGRWAGGLYTPSDGHADPEKATDALARAAVAHGAQHPPRVRGGRRRHARRRGERGRDGARRDRHLLGGLRRGGVVVAARADPRPGPAAAVGARHGRAHDAGAARHPLRRLGAGRGLPPAARRQLQYRRGRRARSRRHARFPAPGPVLPAELLEEQGDVPLPRRAAARAQPARGPARIAGAAPAAGLGSRHRARAESRQGARAAWPSSGASCRPCGISASRGAGPATSTPRPICCPCWARWRRRAASCSPPGSAATASRWGRWRGAWSPS